MAVSEASLGLQALEQGDGVLRLAPTWVPRSFCTPGRRLKLHPDDYYTLGGRGGIDERWLASTVWADNGPGTPTDEGLSHVVVGDRRVTFAEVVETLGADIVGDDLWRRAGGWPMFAKFFDNQGPLPFHVHHRDEHARLVGRLGKPEAYYYPPQLNSHSGTAPYTFFGLDPATTPDQAKERLAVFGKQDNRITELSRSYRLRLGTGWDVPAGVLHGPGSLCTYEPQRASDVFAICECLTNGTMQGEELLWKDVPADRVGDLDFLIELLDWDANVDPAFARRRFMEPVAARDEAEMAGAGYDERWIVYKSDAFSAKQVTVHPGRSVTITEPAAYGLVVVQGHGTLNGRSIESPTMIRYGQLTEDELFVSAGAAAAGVTIVNPSAVEPIVILEHFGPGHPNLPPTQT